MNAISLYFDVTFGAALLDLIFVPTGVWLRNLFRALGLSEHNEYCDKGDFADKICHLFRY